MCETWCYPGPAPPEPCSRAAWQVRVVEILPTGKVSVSQKSEEEAAQEKQMATSGMSSGVSTAGMSLLQAALARAGVTSETFATEVRSGDAHRPVLDAIMWLLL